MEWPTLSMVDCSSLSESPVEICFDFQGWHVLMPATGGLLPLNDWYGKTY